MPMMKQFYVFFGLTELEVDKSAIPMGTKATPININVPTTQLGVRIGCHAFSRCCLNGESDGLFLFLVAIFPMMKQLPLFVLWFFEKSQCQIHPNFIKIITRNMPRRKTSPQKSLETLDDATNMEVQFFLPKFVPTIPPPAHGQIAHASKSKKQRKR